MLGIGVNVDPQPLKLSVSGNTVTANAVFSEVAYMLGILLVVNLAHQPLRLLALGSQLRGGVGIGLALLSGRVRAPVRACERDEHQQNRDQAGVKAHLLL